MIMIENSLDRMIEVGLSDICKLLLTKSFCNYEVTFKMNGAEHESDIINAYDCYNKYRGYKVFLLRSKRGRSKLLDFKLVKEEDIEDFKRSPYTTPSIFFTMYRESYDYKNCRSFLNKSMRNFRKYYGRDF